MEYESLDPEVRAHALVGYFLQSWAFMEARLNDVIGKALGIDKMLQTILCSNMQLRDKINTAKTAVDYEAIPRDKKDSYTKSLNWIIGKSHVRNMMAHDMFGVNEAKDGVEWFSVKAKGKLIFPNNDWNVAKFHQEVAEVYSTRDTLVEIQKAITSAKLVRLLLKHPLPNQEQDGPTMFGPQPPHSQAAPLLGMWSANFQTTSENPQETEE